MPARVFHILVHFFTVHCKTTTSNNQIKGFVENMNAQRLNFYSLFERESCPHKTISWTTMQSPYTTKQIGTSAT